MSKATDATIFITGGAGFIGSYVVELLLPLNPKKIIILDNLIRGSHENMENFANDPRVEFIEGDIRNHDLVNEIIHRSDYIFHMAALRINACAADPVEAFEVMAKATFNIIETARHAKIKKIIYSSTASIYGLAQNFPTPETDNPYDNQTFYGAAKSFGESMLRSYKYMFDLDFVAFRYFNVFGPRMDTDGKYTEVMIKWLDCIRDGKAPLIYGDGSTSMDFVYVKDVARANIAALESDVTDEVFNVGNCRETSLAQLLDSMLQVNNSDLKPAFVEEKVANPVSRRLADVSKAERMLGFKAETSLEDGLKILSEWYFAKKQVNA